jgi:hypothetical protein
MASPIKVRKTTNWKGEVVWAWDCTEHVRCRGWHHSNRRLDRYLARRGKPPDRHPWERAQEGAVHHWHRYHATECSCPTRRNKP